MDILWEEITYGLPDKRQFIQLVLRLLVSAAIAGLIGYQRQTSGKAAGLRTHILVSLGATILVSGVMFAGFASDAMSRVIQGIITGIGFIGAGTILKQHHDIKGLTTSAGLWATCAIGIVVGLGHLVVAVVAAVVVYLVLTVVKWIDIDIEETLEHEKEKAWDASAAENDKK